MSEIKANLLTPATASTVTLGSSGQTIALGSGATATGFGGGKVLQVIQTPFTSTGSATVTTPTFSSNIFSGVITPSATSSKVLVFVSVNMGVSSGTYNVGARLVRGSTVIGSTPDSPGSNRLQCFGGGRDFIANGLEQFSMNFLDSPNTVSATTYGVQISSQAGVTTYVNRTGANTDATDECRAVSHMCLMEIGA